MAMILLRDSTMVLCPMKNHQQFPSNPKKLKEKFDDIFQSAEYVKVMAAFKKERKTQHETFKAWDQKKLKILVYNVSLIKFFYP